MMQSLGHSYPELEWSENADVEVADLLKKVALGEVDFTIADSTEFAIQRHFYPELRVALDLKTAVHACALGLDAVLYTANKAEIEGIVKKVGVKVRWSIVFFYVFLFMFI